MYAQNGRTFAVSAYADGEMAGSHNCGLWLLSGNAKQDAFLYVCIADTHMHMYVCIYA